MTSLNMKAPLTPQQIASFIVTALECSVYVAPHSPGLTYSEIVEICTGCGFKEGEIRDAYNTLSLEHLHREKVLPVRTVTMMWTSFGHNRTRRHISTKVFDFLHFELMDQVREMGSQKAQIDRDVLVQRGVEQGHDRNLLEGAISLWTVTGHLINEADSIRFAQQREKYPPPSEQETKLTFGKEWPADETREQIYPRVNDVIARRSDGRPASPEPLRAFGERLEVLGYKAARMWWTQTVGELQRSSSDNCPVAVSVLAAALVEASLVFAAIHSRKLGLLSFGGRALDGGYERWKIEDLINGAAHRDAGIFDIAMKARVDSLFVTRRRIHAGRTFADYPTGLPDLRPEDARDGKRTTDLVVRRVMDWLDTLPPASMT